MPQPPWNSPSTPEATQLQTYLTKLQMTGLQGLLASQVAVAVGATSSDLQGWEGPVCHLLCGVSLEDISNWYEEFLKADCAERNLSFQLRVCSHLDHPEGLGPGICTALWLPSHGEGAVAVRAQALISGGTDWASLSFPNPAHQAYPEAPDCLLSMLPASKGQLVFASLSYALSPWKWINA